MQSSNKFLRTSWRWFNRERIPHKPNCNKTSISELIYYIVYCLVSSWTVISKNVRLLSIFSSIHCFNSFVIGCQHHNVKVLFGWLSSSLLMLWIESEEKGTLVLELAVIKLSQCQKCLNESNHLGIITKLTGETASHIRPKHKMTSPHTNWLTSSMEDKRIKNECLRHILERYARC